MTRKERFDYIIDYFSSTMPEAATELMYRNPYQLLVAVILSAQCTDKRVNMITKEFYKHFPDPVSLSEAGNGEVYEVIKSCSYPNNKTRHLIGMAKMLVNDFNQVVPDDIKELQKLPGVGRKTANVIASVVYNQPALAVDTHVFRVAARIGLTHNAKTSLQTEKQLLKYFPENLVARAHHWLILHGRYVCKARKPLCEECGLTSICKYYKRLRD